MDEFYQTIITDLYINISDMFSCTWRSIREVKIKGVSKVHSEF